MLPENDDKGYSYDSNDDKEDIVIEGDTDGERERIKVINDSKRGIGKNMNALVSDKL